MPRAAESPTRKPVKLPGPVVTAMRSSAAKAMPDSFITRAISGISASAWPRFIGCDSCAISWLASVSSTRGGAGVERGIDGEDQHAGLVHIYDERRAVLAVMAGLSQPSTPSGPNVDPGTQREARFSA